MLKSRNCSLIFIRKFSIDFHIFLNRHKKRNENSNGEKSEDVIEEDQLGNGENNAAATSSSAATPSTSQ